MDPHVVPYYGHNTDLIHEIHDWLYYHHVWATPLIAFVFTVLVCFVTMKFYIWWRFDRAGSKNRCPKIKFRG